MADSIKDYLQSMAEKVAPGANPVQIKMMEKAMAKYGDIHWWEYPDKRDRACWQLFEPVLIIPFEDFRSGLENLVGRKIEDSEFAFDVEKLKKEARTAWDKWKGQNK